jgi:RNA polymerase sigma-70 factor (ECF subfamily)
LEAYCRKSLRDASAAGDVLQSAVAAAFGDFHLYAEGTNFRAWMFRYVSREVLNRNRASSRSRTVELTEESLATPPAIDLAAGERDLLDQLLEEPGAILESFDGAVSTAVRGLPDMERQIMLLRALGEFKYREIAEILDVALGTVMSHLSRARERLRQQLVEYGRAEGWLKGSSD